MDVFDTFPLSWKTEFTAFARTAESLIDGCSVYQWADYYSNSDMKQIAPKFKSATCQLTEFYNFVRIENLPTSTPTCDEERINGLQTFSAIRRLPHTEFVNGVRFGLTRLKLSPFFSDLKSTTSIKLNGTILCYAAARVDRAQNENPFFDRVIGCAKKLLTISEYEKVIESACRYSLTNPDGSELNYELNVLQARVFNIKTFLRK